MGSCSSTTVTNDQGRKSLINEQLAHVIGNSVKAAMTDPNAAVRYADTVGMDSANRKVLHVFAEKGKEAGIKALFTSEDGERTLSYAESRALYG